MFIANDEKKVPMYYWKSEGAPTLRMPVLLGNFSVWNGEHSAPFVASDRTNRDDMGSGLRCVPPYNRQLSMACQCVE